MTRTEAPATQTLYFATRDGKVVGQEGSRREIQAYVNRNNAAARRITGTSATYAVVAYEVTAR